MKYVGKSRRPVTRRRVGLNTSASASAVKPIPLLLAVCASSAAFAQKAEDANPIEEVVVTTLRQSLITSETIKQNSSGVVDAVTSEDIGKFPDTNLAEAIQRVPGVTIDRQNNEGSRVTVRGFGPEFNLVTLNGRSMPGGYSPTSASATRSFDFANLSPVGIASIAVYKTGRADVPSGGIGSTIDITTPRPFDYNGLRTTLQVMANDDTSTRVGAKVTPEVSGLFSDTFLDRRVGVLASGSYSKRNSSQEFADVGGWLENPQGVIAPGSASPTGVTNNNKNPYGNYWGPQSEDWGFYDHQRVRENGQLVLQFNPVDSLIATTDYTYSLFKDSQQRHSMGAWFGYGGDLTSATINEHGTITNLVDAGNDLSYFASHDEFRNEGKSLGVNLKWQALDKLLITADAHHSSEDSGGGPGGNNAFFIVGQQPAYSTTKTFTNVGTEIPLTTWGYVPPYTLGTLGTSTISPLFAQDNSTTFSTLIKEARLDALWTNESGFLHGIKVGYDFKDMQTVSKTFNSFYPTGFYDPASDGLIPSSAFTKVSSCSILRSFSGGGCGMQVPYFYTFNVADAVAATTGKYNYQFVLPDTPASDNRIQEKTHSVYGQLDFDTDLLHRRFKAMAGLRYERTTVTANSLQQVPTAVSWDNPTEFHTIYAAQQAYSDVGSSYHELLPNLDLSWEVLQKVLLRASYSKTITRSDLTQMIGTEAVSTTPKPGARTVTAGNPALLPYSSKNYDLAVEWYYSDGSYLSANWFMKRVTNFLTQTTTQGPVFGLTDPLNGAIAQKATAELQAAGQPTTAANVFNQMVKDTGQTSFVGQPGDPLVVWDITAPSNANATEIHGFEFAVQHLFGQTGFGVQANVSLPTGGAQFNNLIIGSQFALPGLSKSYNIVGFYEKHGFQMRLAYTHRSSFLTALSQAQSANEPQNVAAYGQLDMSASYDFNEHFGLSFDAINLTSESQRFYGRYTDQFLYAYEGAARYQFGFRFKL